MVIAEWRLNANMALAVGVEVPSIWVVLAMCWLIAAAAVAVLGAAVAALVSLYSSLMSQLLSAMLSNESFWLLSSIGSLFAFG